MSGDLAGGGLAGIETRFTELGRIRMGHKVDGVTKQGKAYTRPEKLEHWRLTSRSEALLQQAAALYGGDVHEWEGAPTGRQYELFTDTDALDVMIPPLVDRVVRRHWELWKGAECIRRCDGEADIRTGEACECPLDLEQRADLAAKGEACKPTTRLSVMLPYIAGLGVWRLEIHGRNGAAELAGTAQMLAVLGTRGQLAEATLWLDQRSSRHDGQTVNYAVPVLESKDRMADFVLAGRASAAELAGGSPGQLPAPTSGSSAWSSEVEAPQRHRKEGAEDPDELPPGLDPGAGGGAGGTRSASGDDPAPAAAETGRADPGDGAPSGAAPRVLPARSPTVAEVIVSAGHTFESVLEVLAGREGWADLGGRNAHAKLKGIRGARLEQLRLVLAEVGPAKQDEGGEAP